MFFQKHKKVFKVIIVFLMLISLFSLLGVDNDGSNENVIVYSPDDIACLEEFGYYVENIDGKWIYNYNHHDPQILFKLNGEVFNTVNIKFNEEDLKLIHCQLYYSTAPDVPLCEQNSIVTELKPDGKTLTFSLPHNHYYTLRLDLLGQFSFESIELSTLAIVRKVNVLPIVMFVLALAASIALERYIGLYASLINWIKNEIEGFRGKYDKKKVVHLVLRYLMILSTAAFVIAFYICTAFIIFSAKSIILIFALGALALISNLVYRIIYKKADNVAALFLVVALIIGAVFSYAFPITTFNSWDEDVHYARSVELKNFLFTNHKTMADLMQEKRLYSSDRLRETFNIGEMLVDNTIEIESERKLVNVYLYSAYLPVSFMMFMADVFSTNYFTEVVLAKVMNIVVYAAVIYFGLKKLKSGAHLISTLCLIPTTLFIAASFSYDHWVVAFLTYAFCYFISEIQNPDKKLGLKDAILMLGAVFLGCAPKAIYFLVALPFIFMKKSKFDTERHAKMYRIACFIVMLLVLISFILPFFVDMDSRTDDRGGATVDAGAQVKYILTKPFEYAKILFEFMGTYVTFNTLQSEMVSYCLMGKPEVVYSTILVILLLFCSFYDREHDRIENSLKIRLSAVLSCFLTIVLIITALYVSYTPLMHYTVRGVQPRYMIPLLLPFCYALGSPGAKFRIPKRVLNGIVFGTVAAIILISFGNTYVSTFAV